MPRRRRHPPIRVPSTHTGLFRAPRGELRARRVGGRFQDTMGFTVVGPNRFLGSGHPDLRERQPPFLGLIESRDAGRTWRSVSLLGKADFHVLEARGRRIYGFGSDFGSRTARFLTSGDGGRSWRRLKPPQPLVSLAISPRSARELVASGTQRLFSSRDGGASWAALDAPGPGLLAWTRRGVFLADGTGRVWHDASASGQWRRAGTVGGEPAAFDSAPDGSLLAALHDGRIMLSTDDGRSWTVRSRP
jgi:photosystem II stability/assembly factor-like uncharacterized protein